MNITDTSVVCECNHLTHFAILLSPNLNVSIAALHRSTVYKGDDPLPNGHPPPMQITGTPHAVALQFIGYVGVSISLVCMVLTIVALLALK